MREKLCQEIAYMWREAENKYLETGSDNEKLKVLSYQFRQRLTKAEVKLVEDIASSMGV